MSCIEICPLEQNAFDDLSPGRVKDDEVLYRSGFSEHFGDENRIRSKAINNKELLAHDSLSFWRAFSEEATEMARAEGKLRENTPADKVLKKKLTPTAKDVRELRSVEGLRLFCVIDDVRTDNSGGKDPLHAGIRLCGSLMPLNAMDPVYVSARDALLELLEFTARELQTLPEGYGESALIGGNEASA